MNDKLFISELQLDTGAKLSDIIYEGNLQSLKETIATDSPIIFKSSQFFRKIFIPYASSIVYFVFAESDEPLQKNKTKSSETFTAKNFFDNMKNKPDALTAEEINALLGECDTPTDEKSKAESKRLTDAELQEIYNFCKKIGITAEDMKKVDDFTTQFWFKNFF